MSEPGQIMITAPNNIAAIPGSRYTSQNPAIHFSQQYTSLHHMSDTRHISHICEIYEKFSDAIYDIFR